MTRMHGDERGIAGTVVVISMVFIIAMLALVFDGGILFIQRRHIVNAADAAALAAAQTYAMGTAQCGSNDGPAQANADSTATSNYPSASRIVYQTDCANGKVKVGYQATVGGLFSSSHIVATKSTGQWGNVSGAIVPPVEITQSGLTNCNFAGFPDAPPPGTEPQCTVQFPKLGSGDWGGLNISNPPASASSCQAGSPLGWNVCSASRVNCKGASAIRVSRGCAFFSPIACR